MPDLRDRLEGLAAGFPERRGMDGLKRRRDRRRRVSRVLTGTLALLIAATGTASAFLAFRDIAHGPAADHATELPPDVLLLECSQNGPVVHTPTVRPQRDGVHIEARNTSDHVLIYDVGGPGGGTGRDIPPGGDHATVAGHIAPGRGTFGCARPLTDPSDELKLEFEIVDPEGLWVSGGLDCQGGVAVTGSVLYGGGPDGETGTPEDYVRKHHADELREEDVLDRAGYPVATKAWGATVRVVRDGRPVATFHLFGNEQEGWYQDSYSACQEF